jgi:hypothetical protein
VVRALDNLPPFETRFGEKREHVFVFGEIVLVEGISNLPEKGVELGASHGVADDEGPSRLEIPGETAEGRVFIVDMGEQGETDDSIEDPVPQGGGLGVGLEKMDVRPVLFGPAGREHFQGEIDFEDPAGFTDGLEEEGNDLSGPAPDVEDEVAFPKPEVGADEGDPGVLAWRAVIRVPAGSPVLEEAELGEVDGRRRGPWARATRQRARVNQLHGRFIRCE